MEDPSERKALEDLSKTIHRIGHHIVALHRHIDKREEEVEETEDEWTTRGWEPPAGADRSPGEA
ncbi:MAG: hypothetical protein JO325_12180 [Solirubrobacterales bacterium]|nr:hypothetical protein [Solirubrobacterales bacterium]